MVLDAVVARRNELVVLVVRDLIDTGPTAHRAVAGAQVDLNVHHVVLLNVFRLIVLSAVEDEIPWLHLIKLQAYRQRIELVGLITRTKLEAKMLTKIINCPSDQCTAV